MKLLSVLFALLALLATSIQVLAWDNLDHEIFDIVSELQASEGKGTTFYSWLDVPSTATTAEIAKAYRKKSMVLHPDKNPGVKGIHERFSRLGVISTILRDKEKRERYDFFYKNGVPKWRGTGYYYSRFRPGLGFVATFLIVLTSALQYLVQSLNYKRDLGRIAAITNKAKAAAWGPKMIPLNSARKVRVNLGDAHDEDGNVYDTRWIDMVVDSSDVYMLQDGEQVLIDASTASPPAISRTWFVALVKAQISRVLGEKKMTETVPIDEKSGGIDESDSEDSTDTPASGTATPNGTVKAGHLPTSKAGGKRRKAVKKR
ncbi:DnaJ-domain-containing protein [Coprinopsis marcescibilis]|uniref:DnaJ-domain-containing protein n=1 Tax=Coprinopsis marcescibilis TaxID=230819 RepID=A0A5C3L4V9_COPMA|nr:DnaJ-domain-containing protein [Coprinopsis marcescibilis]